MNTTETIKRVIVNKFPGVCRHCGVKVATGAGEAVLIEGGGWKTQCVSCPNSEPGTVTQPQSTVPQFTPTAEQAEIVALFATGKDLVVQAGAGTGKTSTLVLLANQALANDRKGQYTAFNKDIVTDTAGKMPGNVNCSTMHSLAYQAIGKKFVARMESSRQRPDEQARILGIRSLDVVVNGQPRILRAGWLAGQCLIAVDRFCSSADREITSRHFAPIETLLSTKADGILDYSAHNEVAEYLLPFAHKAWADLTNVKGQLRFNHSVYIKLWSLGSPRINADFIMLDEAQDADPVQVAIIEAQRQHGTQIVVVGDEQQVIYEWRGSLDALGKFERMGANVAFLSQSFRFGDAVAEVANGLLGRLNARLRIQGFGASASVIGPISEPDAILSRSNAGAIKALLSEAAKGRVTYLTGTPKRGPHPVVWFCEAALALQAGRSTTHPELACFDSWLAVELFVAEDEQGGDLKLMVKIIKEFGAQAIVDAIKYQPADEADADVVISTAHKSKGREWGSVQLAGDFPAPKDGEDLSPSDLRLLYVAVTRAKRQLDITAVPQALGFTPGDEGDEDDPEGDVTVPEPPAPTPAAPTAAKASPVIQEPSPAPVVTGGPLHQVTLRGVTYYSRFLGRCEWCDTRARLEIPASAPIKSRWVFQPPTHSCTKCGRSVAVKAVAGKLTEGRCDPRCWNAVGNDCSCSCAGEFHGQGHGPEKGKK